MKITQGIKVCVTGAASGIGRATAVAFARRGAQLFLTDINAAGLNECCQLAESAGGKVCKQEAFDISDYAAVKAFADGIHQEFGALDILINNAGIALFALVEDMTHAHWQKIINVDLWGPIHGIECFVPEMIRARHGHIVSVSSTAGLMGLPWHAAYSTAKWGLVGLSEVLRYDLAQHNVKVSVVCPGAVNTPIKHAVEILGADKQSDSVQAIMRRFEKHAITPERVADIIINAIERNKFLVITTSDIKALYFLKHRCFPAYHFIMSKVSALLNSMKKGS